MQKITDDQITIINKMRITNTQYSIAELLNFIWNLELLFCHARPESFWD
jgi:hypothetical protein